MTGKFHPSPSQQPAAPTKQAPTLDPWVPWKSLESLGIMPQQRLSTLISAWYSRPVNAGRFFVTLLTLSLPPAIYVYPCLAAILPDCIRLACLTFEVCGRNVTFVIAHDNLNAIGLAWLRLF
jgi:hypothetical protein